MDGAATLAEIAPDVLTEIEQVCPQLEAEFGDAQEFEFTIQDGELFLLQTRVAKRTPWAALQIAVDQAREGLIPKQTAIDRIKPLDLGAIRRLHVVPGSGADALAHATPASVGVAIGPLALDAAAAGRFLRAGTAPVLVRSGTVTDDIAAVAVSAGVLTGAGGRTSHAAVVARELGKPCLVGCPGLELDLTARTARIGGKLFSEGEVICLDAESGLVFGGAPEIVEQRPSEALREITEWCANVPAATESDRLALST